MERPPNHERLKAGKEGGSIKPAKSYGRVEKANPGWKKQNGVGKTGSPFPKCIDVGC